MNTLSFLYTTKPGRLLLKPLTSRTVSKLTGRFLDSKLSRFLVPGFITNNDLNTAEFEKTDFSSFNDCFSRRLKDGSRIIDKDKDAMIAPCDGLLTVVPTFGGPDDDHRPDSGR